MPSDIFDPVVSRTIADAQAAATQARTKAVTVDGPPRTVRYLQRLGAKAIWLSPVLKNARPAGWRSWTSS